MKSKEQPVNRTAVKLSEGRCAATRFRELCNIPSEMPGVRETKGGRGGRGD